MSSSDPTPRRYAKDSRAAKLRPTLADLHAGRDAATPASMVQRQSLQVDTDTHSYDIAVYQWAHGNSERYTVEVVSIDDGGRASEWRAVASSPARADVLVANILEVLA